MTEEYILKEIKRIEEKINSYYDDKKIVIIENGEPKNFIAKNVNPDKKYDHPYIKVILNDSEEINACAYKNMNQYYIEMNRGVFIGLKSYIHTIVGKKVFEKVKEVGKVNPKRIENIILENCYTYLCFHEFFHITNGHCDLVEKLQLEKLYEVSNKIGKTPNLIKQTLEYDADCCAIVSMVNEELRITEMIKQQFSENHYLRTSVDSLVQVMSGILIAIFILHSLFHDIFQQYTGCSWEESVKYVKELDHPLPGMRVLYMMLSMLGTVDQSNLYSKEELLEISDRVFSALKSFAEEYKDLIKHDYLKVMITNEGIDHMQNVHDNWEKVMDEIPISYAKLSPFSKCNYKGILKGEW